MRPAVSARTLATAAALCALAATAPAHAWTEARVESAGAHVQVLPDGRARVGLRVGVRVLGGWLSRLDLAGLDPALVLDPEQPPAVVLEDGQRLLPEAKLKRDGRVVISFASRALAPRRGRHSLELSYFTRLPSEPARDDQRNLRWALPAFRADLRDVDVTIDAPAGAALVPPSDGATLTARSARGERTLLRWQRAQLPRTLAFEAVFRVPAGAAAEARGAAPDQPVRVPGAFGGPGLWPALLLLALVAAKRAAVRATSRAERVRAQPLLTVSSSTRALCALLCAGLAAWLHPTHPLVAAGLFVALASWGLDRGFARLPAPPQRWSRARLALELARLRRTRARRLLGAPAWLDATTPLGLGTLASAYALVGLRAQLGVGPDVWLEALLAATPLWLSASRLRLPPSAIERLAAKPASPRKGEAVPAARPEPQAALTPAGATRPGRAQAA